MISHDDLIQRARTVSRVEDEERAARWLSVTCSILADWGGPQAADILKDAVPSRCLSGKGSSGRSWAEAEKAAGGDARVALVEEAEARSRQPDPRNAAMMLLSLIGLVKAEVESARGTAGVDALVASFPASLQPEIRAASTRAPFGYRLIPQSYERPAKNKAGTH